MSTPLPYAIRLFVMPTALLSVRRPQSQRHTARKSHDHRYCIRVRPPDLLYFRTASSRLA
jgi:hypothetical protein